MSPSAANKPTIVVFTGFFYPGSRAGGPIRSLDALTRLGAGAADFRVVTWDRDSGDTQPYECASPGWVSQPGREVLYVKKGSIRHYCRAIAAVAKVRPDLYYLNSLWNRQFSILPLLLIWARLLPRAPIVLAPRGELLEGALTTKSSRKQIILGPLHFLLKRLSVTLHATSPEENERIAQLLPAIKRFLVPDLFLPHQGAPASPLSDGGPLRICYLSRIHPHKNLLGAIQAVSQLRVETYFEIVGSSLHLEYLQECVEAVKRLPPNVHARFIGHVDHSEVPDTLARFDVFLLPTKSENFGHVIREALASSCIVLTSKSTPWTGMLRSCGLATPEWNDVGGFAAELQRLAAMPRNEIAHLRRHIRRAYEVWEREQSAIVVQMVEHLISTARPTGG